MGDESASRPAGLAGPLVAHWPSLPYLALGVWSAWSALANSGSMWLSDTEVGGINLSVFFICSVLGSGLTLLAAALRARRGRQRGAFVSNRAVLAGGVVASLGCAFIIAIGPYYLGRIFPGDNPLFFPASFVVGVGTGVIYLRCCELYGALPPRTALLRSALSLALASVVFFIFFACPSWAPVPGGPTWAGIVALCGLPVLAACMANLPSARSGAGAGVPTQPAGAPVAARREARGGAAGGESAGGATWERMPTTFWKLTAFSLVIALAISMLRGSVVLTHPLATTVDGNNILMLLRLVFALAFVALGTIGDAHHINLGRICSLVAVVSAVCVACVSAFGALATGWSVIVYFFSSVLEFVTWCMLAFLVKQKGLSAPYVFGWGRAAFYLGCGIGWLLGVTVCQAIPTGQALSLFYLGVAGVMLVSSLLLFSEKDYDRLFLPDGEHELPLEDLLEIDAALTGGGAAGRKEGTFGRAVRRLALTAALSEREAEAFRYLAMGYGTDRVASEMGVSVNTVRVHTHNVYVKLDVHSRRELMELVDREVAYERRIPVGGAGASGASGDDGPGSGA